MNENYFKKAVTYGGESPRGRRCRGYNALKPRKSSDVISGDGDLSAPIAVWGVRGGKVEEMNDGPREHVPLARHSGTIASSV